MNKIKEFFARIMNGKYGFDELAKFCSSVALVLILLNFLTRNVFMDLIIWLLFVIIAFRSLSRNFYKRQRENSIFLRMRDSFRQEMNLQSNRWKNRKIFS